MDANGYFALSSISFAHSLLTHGPKKYNELLMKIVLTGASRGIGFHTVRQLAKDSNHQILALSRNEDGLQQLKKTCQTEFNAKIQTLSLDLAQLDEDALLDKIKLLGGVDIIIHNAGLLINKDFEQLTSEDWLRTYQVNVFGVAQLTKIVLPYLKESSSPHILNIGSMGGFQGASKFPTLSAYSTSKAALASLTECLAEEFKPLGIRVNCLALGAVQTEMLAAAFPGFQAPLTADQMGTFVADFAVKGHQFFNGKILPVSISTP